MSSQPIDLPEHPVVDLAQRLHRRLNALAEVFGDSTVGILRRGLDCFASRLSPDDRDLLHRIERRYCDRENV